MMNLQRILFLSILSSAVSFQNSARWNTAGAATRSSTTIVQGSKGDNDDSFEDRRSFVNSLFVGAAALSTASTVLPTGPANAGIDPTMLRNYKVEGDISGTAQRLRQIEEIQRPRTDTIDIPYEKLPSGVEYREYREGKGEAGT